MDDTQFLPRRRATQRPQWSGLVPAALFARLEAEPVVGDALCGLGDSLLENANGRMLEFVALRTSVVRDCLYMWRGHCRIALRRPDEPLSAEEIARIAVGPAAFAGSDAATLAAIDELLANGRFSARTRSAVGERELILTIASLFYDTIAIIMRDAVPDEDPVAGLETPFDAARAVAR
jgi:alkylhydroperoxidase family enzyme